jgi:MSHA biogenesis protein MshL
VLLAFSKESGENLVVDPDVTGTVTVDLYQVTLEQALDSILTPLGYTYRREGRVIRISKPRLQTKIFSLSYINTTRKGTKTMSASHGTAAEGEKISGSESSVTGIDQLDPWAEIQEGLTALIFGTEKPEEVVKARTEGPVTSLTSKDGKKLVISRMSGVILVRDYPEELHEIARFLEEVEGSVQRQVLIQIRVFEVTLKDEYQAGIRWDNIQQQLLTLDISTFRLAWDVGTGTTDATGILGITGASGTFTLDKLVGALETQGKVNALSSPRVSTLNNQAAIVKITDQDVYFTSEISQAQVTTVTSVTPHVIDVGVILDVTPQIAPEGFIIMNIHPSISEKLRDVDVPGSSGVGGTTFPLLTVRETDTVVKVRHGQTIVIAGLLKDRKEEERTGLPCLMNIPGLGHLFRFTEQKINKSELVILLTPTVMAGKTIDELTAEEHKTLDKLRDESVVHDRERFLERKNW